MGLGQIDELGRRWGLGCNDELSERERGESDWVELRMRHGRGGGSSFGTDEAEVGQASVGTASVSLRDGEMVRVNRIVSEVRWRDGSLRVMRERTVR